jgi:hypothetical protein
MAVWTPLDPWPSTTPGGTAAPGWGGYVKLWVRAGIAPGLPFRLGPDTNDNLSSGYVLGPATDDSGGFLGDRLWIDLTCDVLDVDVQGGASAGAGIFTTVDATTATIRLADPEGIYDPLWNGGPFSYGGHSRLVPSVPVEVFAEVVNGATGAVQRFPIFTGTADAWQQDWTPRPSTRQTVLVASDQTKVWNRYNAVEQPAVGAGETVQARLHRIVSFFAWPGTVIDAPGGSPRTLQSTTLAQSGWEMLNRTIDDELGAIYFTPAGALRWVNRETWLQQPPPRITLGCERVDADARDVLIDATPAKLDLQMRNDVVASRTGGTQLREFSQASIDRYGPYGYKRTDLGLADDGQVAQWGALVVQLSAFPQVGIENVTMLPAIDPRSWEIWATVLDFQAFTDIAEVIWAPPDLPDHIVDGTTRVVGVKHAITRQQWSVAWQLVAARPISVTGTIFVLGPSATDTLDQGYILG